MSIKGLCQNYQTIGETIRENMRPSTDFDFKRVNHKNLMMFINLYIPDLAHKHHIFEYVTGLCAYLNEMKMNHAQRDSFLYTGMHQTYHIEEVVQDEVNAIAGSIIRDIGGRGWVNFFDSPEYFHVQNVVNKGEETLNAMTGKVTYHQEYFCLHVSW